MTAQGVNIKGEPIRPLLITGATGTLGRATARLCEMRGLSYRLLTRKEMDIADTESVEKAIAEYEPWAIVNTAGYVRVDDAEGEAEKCLRENTVGPRVLAEACARESIRFVTFSSDLVFDGTKHAPYVESDEARPLNVYGRSKLEAEREVLRINPQALIIRTSAFFGPWDEYNFLTIALRALSNGERFAAAKDAVISPTYVPDLVNATLDLLIDAEKGVWHLSNAGETTWASFAQSAANEAGLNIGLIDAWPTKAFNYIAPRPAYSVLTSERGQLLPPLEDAIKRYVRDCEVSLASSREEKSVVSNSKAKVINSGIEFGT
jgi:dTDP-4-dehydrorhamnose reductase